MGDLRYRLHQKITDLQAQRCPIGEGPDQQQGSQLLPPSARQPPASPERELTPVLLLQACCAAIPVDGAGLSITHDLRVPLAVSSSHVATAEQAQTSLGDGPCLEAARTAMPLAADDEQMAQRWPFYHHALTTQTPFRSTCSLPLTQLPGSQIVMDLFSHQPNPDIFGDPHQLQAEIAAPIANRLLQSLRGVDNTASGQPRQPGPNQPVNPFTNEQAQDRLRVWAAVGMMMAHLNTDNTTALAILRGYAFRNDITIDETAWLLTQRHIEPDDIRP